MGVADTADGDGRPAADSDERAAADGSARSAADPDALVVGGGPAGYAAAIELGRRGRRVVLVDRGVAIDQPSILLTPRAIAAARRLGLDVVERAADPSVADPGAADAWHPVGDVRLSDFTSERSTVVAWPRARQLRGPGAVGTRAALVGSLRRLADEYGVVTMSGCDAVEPIVDRGFVRGAHVRDHVSRTREIRAAYTVVADGPNSPFGRLLGTLRLPDWPVAVAQAADYRSPRHDDGEIEIVLGLTDRAGTPIVGYGWLFPTGAGTVSVGVIMTSTSPSFQVVNPNHLLERFVQHARDRWQLSHEPVTAPTGGRIPLGASVGPLAGPTYLTVGDAGGAANPLTGMGVETALETGALAGEVVGEAIAEGTAGELQQYPKRFDDRYGSYYKVGRLTTRLISQPSVARRVFATTASRRSVADGALRIAAQHLRGVRGGGAELVYRLARALSAVAPDA